MQAKAGDGCLGYMKLFYDEKIGRESGYFIKVGWCGVVLWGVVMEGGVWCGVVGYGVGGWGVVWVSAVLYDCVV